ncbi:hypothetical protein CCP3SC1AL1_4660001 [Gammaproteobacteria bacterium]
MPGTVVEVLVQVGQEVKAGMPLLVAEAMKMQSEIHAPICGKVKAIYVVSGDAIVPNEALIEVE